MDQLIDVQPLAAPEEPPRASRINTHISRGRSDSLHAVTHTSIDGLNRNLLAINGQLRTEIAALNTRLSIVSESIRTEISNLACLMCLCFIVLH